MPSFTLYDLNPEFWARVQAKAAAEGLSVKALILKALAQYLGVLALAWLSVACAYHSPTAPTPPTPIAETVPYTLALSGVSGLGVDAGHASVLAKVQNVKGAPLAGIVVAFTTDAGSLSPAAVTTDSNGMAATTLTAAMTAAVTATAGPLTTHTLIASQPISSAPPVPLPPVVPVPAPPAGALSVTITAAAVTLGAQTLIQADVKNGPPQSVTWSYGDGTVFEGQSTTTAHTYLAAGTYLVGVTVTDPIGRTARASVAATVNPVPPPPPTPPAPPPSLTATLTANATVVAQGQTLTFTVALTNGADGDTIRFIQWDLDGNASTEFTTVVTTKTSNPYNVPGAFTATVNVTMTSGRSASGTLSFVVTN